MEEKAEYKVRKKQPRRDKITIIGTLFLILFGTLVLVAFALAAWNIFKNIWNG